MTEKRRATYELEAFKASASEEGHLNAIGAAALGFARADIVATIGLMRRSHFQKKLRLTQVQAGEWIGGGPRAFQK